MCCDTVKKLVQFLIAFPFPLLLSRTIPPLSLSASGPVSTPRSRSLLPLTIVDPPPQTSTTQQNNQRTNPTMSDHPQPPPKRSRKLSKPTTAPTIMVWPDLPNPPIPCGMSTEKTHTAPEVFVKQKRSGTSHKEEDGKREGKACIQQEDAFLADRSNDVDVTGSEELSTNAERITEIGIPHQNTEEADTSRPIPVTTPPKSPLIFAYVQPPIPSNVQPSSKRPSIIVPSNGPEFSVDTILSRIVHSSPELKEEISPIPTSQTVPEKTKSQTSAPQMTKQIDTSPDANIWIVANDKVRNIDRSRMSLETLILLRDIAWRSRLMGSQKAHMVTLSSGMALAM